MNRRPLSPAAIVAIVIVVVFLTCLLAACCLAATGAGWFLFRWQSDNRIFNARPVLGSGSGVGDLAPDFSLPGLDGQTVNLSAYRGRAVLLNFWTTWCPYCVDEFPLLQEYAELYDGRLVVLAVDKGESRPDVAGFVTGLDYHFVFLLDEDDAIAGLYRVNAIPLTLFIDSDGFIRKVYEGGMEPEDIEDGLRALGLN